MTTRKSCSAFPSQCLSLREHKELKTLQYFPFPTDKQLFEQWATNSLRSDLLKNGPTYAHNNCQLCELHFVDDFLRLDGKQTKSLTKNAIPTIFKSANCRKNITRNIGEKIIEKDAEPPGPMEEIILLDDEIKTEIIEDEPVMTEMMIAASIPVMDSSQSEQLVNIINSATESASVRTPRPKRARLDKSVAVAKVDSCKKGFQGVQVKTDLMPPIVTQAPKRITSVASQRELIQKNVQLRKLIEKNEAIMDQIRKNYQKIVSDFKQYKDVSSGFHDYE